MTRELLPVQQIQRFETLNATRIKRVHLVDVLSERLNTTARSLDRIRLSGVREAVRGSIKRYTEEIDQLEPVVIDTQVKMAEDYLQEDRIWQRNLKRYGSKIAPDELATYQAEYSDFTLQANDPNIAAGLKILEERKREEEAKTMLASQHPPVVSTVLDESLKTSEEEAGLDLTKLGSGITQLEIATSIPQDPELIQAGVPIPTEQITNTPEDGSATIAVKMAPKNLESTEVSQEPLNLPEVGLSASQQEFVKYFPLEEELVVSRLEILHSEWSEVDKLLIPDRFIRTVKRIQEKLVKAGFSIINFEPDHKADSLYGIRKLADYEGLLDMSSYTPRILPAQEADDISSKAPIEINPKSGLTDIQKKSDKEIIKEEAKLLMEQINQSLESGVSLDPVIMQALQEAHDEIMGLTNAKIDIQPSTQPIASEIKRPTSGLEDFLPELPVSPAFSVKTEAVGKIIPFEQREEDKIQPEERYFLIFVFGLLNEAKVRNQQYIDNSDFKEKLKPRREYEQDGKTFVESYSTKDIVHLFGTALDKLIKESQQPLIQWDEETRDLFQAVTTYAGEKGKNIETIRWPLRTQLRAIARKLDMDSRRIVEKN